MLRFMDSFLSRIDRQTTGNRCDVTPVFADAEAFAGLVDHLLGQMTAVAFDRVAAIDALGFILGAAIATRLGKGLIALRKGHKLPLAAMRESFVDYTGEAKSLEMRADIMRKGEAVLLVDEWIETGAQVRAAIALIERGGGRVSGIATINADADAAAALIARGYRIFAATQKW
jgi:adenine phosphoribosyltransferase